MERLAPSFDWSEILPISFMFVVTHINQIVGVPKSIDRSKQSLLNEITDDSRNQGRTGVSVLSLLRSLSEDSSFASAFYH